jgi:prophage regulatory protein
MIRLFLCPARQRIAFGGLFFLEKQMTIINLNRVLEKTTLSRRTIYKYVDKGEFPAPVKVGGYRVAWVESEVDDWINKCIVSRGEAPVPMVSA